MSYYLRIYENNHYADESESYNFGNYETYEEAESVAKAIVEEFLVHNWARGKTAHMLSAEFSLYGEDPVILPPDNITGRKFSARDYVDEIAGSLCLELENRQKKTEVQTLYQEAIKFASSKHQQKDQKVKGTELPYVVHLSNVAMEILVAAAHTSDFNLTYATQAALLHDTIEDTDTTFDEIKERFGEDIAVAVLALSKDNDLPKDQQIEDSLTRIKKLRKEVWAIKLADRITNLQPPPGDWPVEKNLQYVKESQVILDELREGNEYLANRLEAKIAEYRNLNKQSLMDGF